MLNEDDKGNPKAIVPVGSPDEKQLKAEIGKIIENASANEEIIVVLRKTKSGGWYKYVGQSAEEAELALAKTKTETESLRKAGEEHKAELRKGYIKVVFDSLGDLINKVKRGY